MRPFQGIHGLLSAAFLIIFGISTFISDINSYKKGEEEKVSGPLVNNTQTWAQKTKLNIENVPLVFKGILSSWLFH